MKPDISISDRIIELKKYYMSNSQMILDRQLTPWICMHSLDLYTEGWLKSTSAPTVRYRRSMAEAYMLSNIKPVICDGELIVGQPDFTPYTSDEEKSHLKYEMIYSDMIPVKRGRPDHLALDYQKLLEVGVNGLIKEAEEKLTALNTIDGRLAESYEFYDCCIIELKGMLRLAENYCKYAYSLAEKSSDKKRDELLALAKTLEQVPANPATSFREALQSIQLFTYSLFGIYSAGRPDQYLLNYYKKDIQEGRLTEKSAQELIDCFCLQYMNNMSAWAAAGFMLGGRDKNGIAVENELTWHFLASIDHVHAPDPNVGFCVTQETSNDILEFVAKLLKKGNGNPQVWNNDAVSASMEKWGYDKVTSNLFTHSTCVEITPIGCSGVSITSPYINMLKIFLTSLNKTSENAEFEDIYEMFKKEFSDYCKDAILQENLWQLERARNGTDPIRISSLINDCYERGISSENGGAIYNYLEPNMLGMTNVIESLNIINELVYKQKTIDLSEMKKALQSDFKGYEHLHESIINDRSISHFGMGTEEVNKLAKRVADTVLEVFEEFTTYRGAKVIPGAFSYRDHELNGKETSASPDGRFAGTPLAAASSPVQGFERLGPTVSICSTSAWNPSRFLGGTSTNIRLNTDTPVSAIMQLINGFLKTNVVQLQFNIVDPQTLIEAQKNPKNFEDLIVRIGGYSDYFVRIPKSLQDEVISRNKN